MFWGVFLFGCSSWETVPFDKDQVDIYEGDCWFFDEDPTPPAGALDHGVKAGDIYAGAEDLPYDGIDANCDGKDDFDADGDGFVPEEFIGIATLGVDGSGALAGGDCHDDPTENLPVLTPFEVNPSAEDDWYDGVDANCDGKDDFDADEDGVQSSMHPQLDGSVGEDCDDSDASIFPSAEEIALDGVDQNCDELELCFADADGNAG